MKLGLHIPATSWQGGARRLGPTLAQIVETAEAAGFDAIDVADHLWQHPIMGGPTESQIEGYTTLGFIAVCVAVVIATFIADPLHSIAGLGLTVAGVPAYLVWRKRL